jgi:hypothetical protein
LDVTDSTVCRGAGAGVPVVDGRRLDWVFDVRGTSHSSISVTFRGLAVRNGMADSRSGIRVGNADLVVQDCAVADNRAVGPGGVSNAARPGTGNVTLVRTTVARNVSGGDGGGVTVLGGDQGRGSVLAVRGGTVRNNLAGNAAGIWAGTANLTG